MKIKTLIKHLARLPKDTIIVIASDTEGNNYRPLEDAFLGYYIQKSYPKGLFYFTKETYKKDGYTKKQARRAVAIYPI